MKLLFFIRAFCLFDLNKDYNILVIGPVGRDLLKFYFRENFFYSSITNNVPINLSLLPEALFYLLKR